MGRPPGETVTTAATAARGGVGIDRFVLLLVATSSLLALASWRYHLAVRSYARFVLDQVIPKSGLDRRLGPNALAFLAKVDDKAIDNLGSPYSPQHIGIAGGRANAVASDYLGIWRYTREMVLGRNPYRIAGTVVFNVPEGTEPRGTTVEVDPSVPDQVVGNLSYLPTGPAMLLPFYSPNYFVSLARYLGALLAFLLFLALLVVWKSPGFRLPVGLLMATALMTSYPLDFLLDRGNTEGVIFALFVAGVAAYLGRRPVIAAVLFGLAASPKLAPAVLLGLFLLDGDYKAVAAGAAAAVGANVAAMLFMHESPGVLLGQITSHFGEFTQSIQGNTGLIRFNHSVFNAVRGVSLAAAGAGKTEALMAWLHRPYLVAALLATLGVLAGLRSAPFLNRLTALVAMMLAFPYVSADYKLLHLYVPFGLLVLAASRRGFATRPELAAGLAMAVLFAPKTYRPPYGEVHAGIGFAVNSLLLLFLIALSLAAPLGVVAPDGAAGTPAPGVEG